MGMNGCQPASLRSYRPAPCCLAWLRAWLHPIRCPMLHLWPLIRPEARLHRPHIDASLGTLIRNNLLERKRPMQKQCIPFPPFASTWQAPRLPPETQRENATSLKPVHKLCSIHLPNAIAPERIDRGEMGIHRNEPGAAVSAGGTRGGGNKSVSFSVLFSQHHKPQLH